MSRFTKALASEGFSYSDTDFMQIAKAKTLPCPAWAADIVKFRRAVAGKLCQAAHHYGDIPNDLESLRIVEQKAVALLCKGNGCRNYKTSLDSATRNGGLLGFFTAIAWRRFRLGQSSTTIAADLGVSPSVVRRHAAGIAHVARRMYPAPALHLPPAHNSKVVVRPFPELSWSRRAVTRTRQVEEIYDQLAHTSV